MSNVQRSIVPAVLVLALLAPRAAIADDKPFTIGSQPVWVLLAGLTTGGTIAIENRGAHVGGELSLARLRDANWFGFYADGYYDWGVHGTYVTAGVEAGHKWLGIDGGGALRIVSGAVEKGVTGRLTLGLGFLGIYGRYAYFFDTMTSEHVVQIGLLLKLPVLSFGGK